MFLEDIVDAHFVNIISKLEADIAVEASEISDALEILLKLKERADLPEKAGDGIGTIMLRVIDLLLKLLKADQLTGERAVKLSRLRFINVETPQSPYDSTTRPEDLRVESYRDVRATLGALGLDCCDAKPAEGETESAVEKVEKALREGKAPKS